MKYLDSEEKRQRRLVHIPMGRFGEAEEIARTVVFLASGRRLLYHGLDLRRRWRHHRCLRDARVRPPMRFAATVFDLDYTLLAEPLDLLNFL